MNAIKQAVKVALASGLMVLGLGLFSQTEAAGNPDTMTITVTPGGVTYAVAISSPYAQGYNFGQVNIGATTISTLPIAVQNAGNISAFLSLGVVDVTGGGNAWTNAAAPTNLTYAMQGQLVATAAGQPEDSTFTGASNNVPASAPGAASGKFNQSTTKTLPLASKDLWLKLLMPTGVAENGQHTLVLSINGQAS